MRRIHNRRQSRACFETGIQTVRLQAALKTILSSVNYLAFDGVIAMRLQPLRFHLVTLVLLALAPRWASANAQDRPKIEIVPNIPHSEGSPLSRSRPTAPACSREHARRSNYGTRRPGSSCARSRGTPARFTLSPSRPTAPACSRGAGRDDQIMGRRDGQLLRTFEGHAGRGQLCRVLARRHPRALGERTVRRRSNYGTPRRAAVAHVRGAHTTWSSSVAFSPDGTRVLSGS